jgi:uncharacterized protein YjbJ (UPF0337 family)
MYWDQFASQWEEQKHRVVKRWNELTGEDLREINGKWERLVARIMARYGLTIHTAERQILAFLHSIDTDEVRWKDSDNAGRHRDLFSEQIHFGGKPMSPASSSPSRHFHIRWSDGVLDDERFGSSKQADETAKRWARRGEAYTIEEFDESCEKCAEARRKFGSLSSSK